MKIILTLSKISILIALLALTIVPAAAQNACPGAPATRLAGETEGRVAQVYSSLRADIGSPVILRTMRSGETFQITGAPVCSGAHYWIPITYQGVSGWATEGYLTQYWLEPVPEEVASAQGGSEFGTGGALPASNVAYEMADGPGCMNTPDIRLAAGDTAQVAQSYSSLRADVHSDRILRIIRPGVNIEVLDGPFCATVNGVATPYTWYRVSVGTQEGWVTEGTGNTYWLRPVE
ncbi:MAG: hypothetical protein KC496_20270 [Anaerolineae bacterium]|nr:hypothetical protein [Anaerolineae bacterium]